MINRFTTSELKSSDLSGALKSEISHLANTYYSTFRPTKSNLKKYGILKKLCKNPDIIITRPDKGNGVVIIDKTDYITKMNLLLQDQSKFKKLTEDPTLLREG